MCMGHKHCTRQPVYRVKVHRINFCNTPPAQNRYYELCQICVAQLAYQLVETLECIKNHQTQQYPGEPICCVKCQLVITGLHDVFDIEYARTAP
jgi:hypothetical protein